MAAPTSVFAGLAQDATAARGKHNDGREGVHLTKVAQGDLVAVPFWNLALTVAGGASVNYTAPNTSNPMRGKPMAITLPAGAQVYASMSTQVWGRVIGLRGWRHFAYPMPNFALVVDGEVTPVRHLNTRFHTVPASFGGFDGANILALVDDLPNDGPHTVEVIFTGDSTTAFSAVQLFGWLLESSKGYPVFPDTGNSFTSQALTATATALASPGPGKDLTFYNPDSTPHTAYFGTGTTPATSLRSIALAAGETKTIPFPSAVQLSAYKVFQDAAPTTTGAWCVCSFLQDGFSQ